MAAIRDEMHTVMESGAGIYRSGEALAHAVSALRALGVFGRGVRL